MYNSGDAAEQVVRMSLEGAEVALKITGAAAKNLAAALYTVLKDQKKTKGKARIETMLREKRPLKVYTIKKRTARSLPGRPRGTGFSMHLSRYGRRMTPSTSWYSKTTPHGPTGSWRSSSSRWWIRLRLRKILRNPARSAEANRQPRRRPRRKRARRICSSTS